MNLNTPPITKGQISEAEFNSLVSEPWVIPHMNTDEGEHYVDTDWGDPVTLEEQGWRIAKWASSVVLLGLIGWLVWEAL